MIARLRQEALWQPARDIPFLILAATIVLSMRRAVDGPGFEFQLSTTEVRIVITDVALAILAAAIAYCLVGRGGMLKSAWAMVAAGLAFCAWLFISSAVNGLDALVSGIKFLEYGLVALGVLVIVRNRTQLWALIGLLIIVTAVAAGIALLQFFDISPIDGTPGGRNPSFLGEHDLAALSTMSLTVALACLYVSRHPLGRLTLLAAIAGVVGIVLGASIASLVGLYLAVLTIGVLAATRGELTRRALATTAAVVLITTAGVLVLRSGDLGSVLRYVGIAEEDRTLDSQYASSFSQRAILSYIGGRMFLDNPVTGVGWYGTIPPEEYAAYLDDARTRFPDQPASYFPAEDGEFIPQQTYDQVLYELGVVGAILFLALGGTSVRRAISAGRQWPSGGADEALAYVPAAWLFALIGGLAGAALFGGVPFATVFWLTLGVVAVAPMLVPDREQPKTSLPEREVAAVLQ